ncbi:MAG: GAF domain-containing protein, partial [Hyphomicrobiales bacterium]|nr:GAF domain-containing protein [Hyphomicrobiales bacterium]
MMPRRIPLAVKLGATLVSLVVLVLLVNGVIGLWLSYAQAKNAALGVQQEKAQAAAQRVGEFVAEIENEIGWTTRLEWSRLPLEQQRYDFARLLRQVPAITELSYLDTKGKEQLKVSRVEADAVSSGRDFASDPRFVQAVTDKIWFGPVYFRRGSEPYMTVAVAHAGHEPGVTVAEVNLKLIWDVITAIRVGEKGYAYIVDAKGRLVAHPELSLVLRATDFSQLPQVKQALATPAAREAGSPPSSAPAGENAEIATGYEGGSVLTAHAEVPRLNWNVFVQLPLAEALAPVYASLFQTLALLGLGLLLALVLGGFLARRLVLPIRRLQEGAERLGGGDLSQRIAIRTGDEIETLAERFNEMAGRVQESHETLEAKVETRTKDLNEALQQQTATADVLKVISRSAFDLDAVMHTLAQSATQLCEADIGSLHIREGDMLVARGISNSDPKSVAYLRDTPVPINDGTNVGRALLHGTISNIADYKVAEGLRSQRYQEVIQFRSLACVPLMRDGRGLGVFSLGRKRVAQFSERQIELLQTFADQAVIAIENVRLFDEIQAKTRDLAEALRQQTATADVLKVISRSTFDLQTVLDTLVASAAKLCEAEQTCIFKREGELYHWVANHGFSSELVAYAGAHPFAAGPNSTVSRVALEGKAIHIPDVLADPNYTASEYQRLGNYRTMLGVPLLREGKLIGVFVMTREQVKPFNERQIELFQTFADQAVIAIENVRLFEETQA